MSRTPTVRRLMAVALPLASLSAAAAETVAPVTVTATRTAETADETLSSVTVLDRETIRRSQTQSLPDLLARQRGLSFSRNGPYGQSSSLFMRGTNSDHVLVLVDGVKMGSATTGTTAFQHLPLEQIERIEIVRGPRSSLYGSEAVGGVIQIFTRQGAAGETRVDASAMAGHNDTSEFTTAISGGDEDTRFAFSAKAFDTEGIDARQGGSPDADGYENDSFSISLSQDLGETTTWSLNGLHAEGTNQFDGFGVPATEDDETDFVQQSISTKLETQVTRSWSTTLRGGQSRDESTTRPTEDVFDTVRDEFTWQNDLTVGSRQLVTLGYDYREDRIETNNEFDQTSRDNHAVFGQWQWTGDRADLQLSGRHDDNEAYGDQGTGSIAAGYRLGRELRVYTSYGTAFKAPTFNDLFYDSPSFVGNPDLEPEESESVEVGVEGGRAVRWSANLHHTEIENLIEYIDPDGFFGPDPGTMENRDAASITGLELALGTTHGGWDLQGSVTLLDTELETDDMDDGNQLRRRPERVVDFDFSRDFGRVRFGGHVRHESDRFDDAGNNTELDGFTLVDFRLGYDVRQNVSIEASLENATDVQYQTANGYHTLGRTAYLRLRFQP